MIFVGRPEGRPFYLGAARGRKKWPQLKQVPGRSTWPEKVAAAEASTRAQHVAGKSGRS
ncbi:hypothetical protein [Bacillus pumilus]|uniref:hypothetical protein n=1 Tax=Bacillus pumilus TaxID=1408 RepID=UPI003D024EBA